MNSIELDTFLREYTLYEKFILNNINPNDIRSVESFIKNTYYDENIEKKFHLPSDIAIKDYFINFQKRHPGTIRNPIENVEFLCYPRFDKMPEHHHSYIEMIYVYSGELHQTIKGSKVTMKKGEVCILDSNILHSIEAPSENDIAIICLMDKKYLDSILITRLSSNNLLSSFFIHSIYQSDDYNDYILFKSGESKKLAEIMNFVLCEYFNKSLCSDEIINSCMIIIFSELLRVVVNQANSENYTLLENQKISDIILYIQNNCKDATLSSTAEHFHFHPNYLNSIIKKFKGSSFTSVLQDAKFKKASFLLKNSDITVVEVAKIIGYENISFFYKKFKEHYGCNPAKYRKSFQSK
jgi:AraC-like DNA-binding protein/mannose-6-phosphate isomerase-like protein (cupin superfamily)